MNDKIKNILSYKEIINDRDRFLGRVKGLTGFTSLDSQLKRNDEPATVYFKLFFYFNNTAGDSRDDKPFTSNLLGLDNDWGGVPEESAPSISTDSIGGMLEKSNKKNAETPAAFNTDNYTPFVGANTAYNFLLANDEIERAGYLRDFIYLLSEINSNSPWYWQSISGISEAIDKTWLAEGKMEENKSLTITCLPDAFDGRISMLLDLYRAATYSNLRRVSIIPANLRKFDMGVYIFSTPKKDIHNPKINNFAKLDANPGNTTSLIASSKYIEFHNCEINYNSSKDGYSDLSNIDGVRINHKININYGDSMEMTYNQFLMKTVGDMVSTDLSGNWLYDEKNNRQNKSFKTSQNAYDNLLEQDKSFNILQNADDNIGSKFISRLVNQGLNTGKSYAESLVNKLVLGNAHGFSLAGAKQIADKIINGSIIDATKTIISEVQTSQSKESGKEKSAAGGQANPKPVISPPTSKDLGKANHGIIKPTPL